MNWHCFSCNKDAKKKKKPSRVYVTPKRGPEMSV